MKRALLAGLAAALLLAGAAPRARASCTTSVPVTVSGLQSAINTIPATLSGDYCLRLAPGSYNEEIFIGNINTAGFRIIITTQSAGVYFSPNTSLQSSVFKVQNASVTLQGFEITSTVSHSYGVDVASGSVILSSITVSDAVNILTSAAINVQGAPEFRIEHSSASSGTGATATMLLTSVDNAQIYHSTFVAQNGYAAQLSALNWPWISSSVFRGGSTFGLELNQVSSGAISASSFTLFGSGAALDFNASSNNVVTDSFFANGVGKAIFLGSQANYNTIARSTVTIASAGQSALDMNASASFNLFDQDYFQNASGYGISLFNGQFNTVDRSTVVAGSASEAAVILSGSVSSSTTIKRSLLRNPASGGTALNITSNSHDNLLLQSTATVTGAGARAVSVGSAQWNTISGSYLYSPGGDGLRLDPFADNNLVSGTTMYSNTASNFYGLSLVGASSNTVVGSYILSPGGNAVFFLSSHYNTISQTTMTATQAGGGSAVGFDGSNFNTITQSYLAHLTPGLGGAAAWIAGGSSFTVVSQSTMIVTGTSNGSSNSMAVFLAVPNGTVSAGTIQAANGYGVWAAPGSTGGSMLSGLQVLSSTGVLVQGATVTLSNVAVKAAGANAPALLLQPGSVVTVALSSFTAAAVSGKAVNVGGSNLNLTGPIWARGDFAAGPGAAIDAGSWDVFASSNVRWGPAAQLKLAQSTVTLDGAANTVNLQTVQMPGGAGNNFGTLVAKVNNVLFTTSVDANSLVNTLAGSTMTFNAGGPPSNISMFVARGGGGPNGLINLRSSSPGTPWPLNVAGSSITSVSVMDSDASAGSLVHANDLRTLDLGNNTNWNFKPFLTVIVPGETFTPGTGKTGSPFSVPAGPVAVQVVAYASDFTTATLAAFSVVLDGSEPTDQFTGSTQTLQSGTTTFNLILKRGDPAPFTRTLTASSLNAFAPGSGSPQTVANAFAKLQTLLPGESPAPGTPSGKVGSPLNQVAGMPFGVTVRGVDAFWNKISTAADNITISTSGGNFPQTTALNSGATTFTSVVFSTAGSNRTIAATDVSVANVLSSTSSAFSLFNPTSSSPTLTIAYAPNSVQSTLGGGVQGTASDGSGVAHVKVALRQVGGNWFDWSTQTFPFTTPSFKAATLGNPGGVNTSWIIPLADSVLSNTTYYVVAIATNASNNFVQAETTFTLNASALVAGNPADGGGTATASSQNGFQGCQVLQTSFSYTAPSQGIGPGGAVALRLPDNWQRPYAEDPANDPPANSGYVHVSSTRSFTLDLNPSTLGSAQLGDNWIVYKANGGLAPGQKIYIRYTGFPGGGQNAVGQQFFAVQVMGGTGGNLKPIQVSPSFTLSPGPARQLRFRDESPITVGPLQTSPTMQLLVTDYCGNSTNTATASSISMMAGQFGNTDGTAKFYQSGGILLGNSGFNLPLPGGASSTTAFYYVTSTAGVSSETLFATGTVNGSFNIFAGRFVRVLGSSVSLSGVSIDTGTLNAGAKSATMTATGFLGAAVVNFTLSDPALHWEVIISTDPVNYSPELVHRFGIGSSGRQVSWTGLNERVWPNRFVPPGGPYYVKISVEGGVVEDKSLAVYVAPSASVYGTVNSTGAYAFVYANGPGTSFGNFAVASSTGYFQIFGLKQGGRYNIVATTGAVAQGQFLRLQVSSNNVTIPNVAGAAVDLGAMPFPTPSLLRARVQIPAAAPHEFWGGLNVHNSDFSQYVYGTLHFPSGADKSDDGGQSFGSAASSWTVVGVLPGTYTLDVNLQQVGISSSIPGVVVTPGGVTDVNVSLPRKANVYGYAVIPSSTEFGAFISVDATKAGDKRPSIYGGAFIQGYHTGVVVSSSIYALYGLDPGSWTLTARSFGFAAARYSLYISSDADVGDPVNGGFNVTVASGNAINGTLNLVGDSTLLPQLNHSQGQGLDLFINAFCPQTGTNAGTQVHIATHSSLATSTFTIRGLDDGVYFVNAFVLGATPVQMSIPVIGGSTNVVMSMPVNSARVQLTVKLPGAAPDFTKVALFQSGQGGPQLAQNITTIPGATFSSSGGNGTWTSPPLGAGYYTFQALYANTGMFKTISVPLSAAATAFATMDLTASTFSVSGSVVLATNVSFSSAGVTVNVSSVTGVLANSPQTPLCVMGSAAPVNPQAFHLELLPYSEFNGGFLNGPLQPGNAGSCSNPPVPNNVGGNSPNPFLAYIAAIQPDGSFTFPNVPPGTYLLRNPTNVDGDLESEELPAIRQIVTVSSTTTGLSFKIGKGVTVSGTLSMPPGITAQRPFLVALLDSTQSPIRSTVVNMQGSAAAYALDRVPDGSYALVIQDFGYPRVYGGRPLSIKVVGVDVPNQDVAILQTGIIKGKLAIQQTLANSTTRQFLLITGNNFNLLPKSMNIRAEANPWFQGGYAQAFNPNCGNGGFCGGFGLDANDQFVIDNVLPGTYDVRYESYNDPNDNSSINLTRSFTPSVLVGEGRTTDIGTVNLISAVSIRGNVFDAVTSSPIPNISIRARPSISQNREHDEPKASTDKNGAFTLVGLDPGIKLYDIYANARFDDSTQDIPAYELKVAAGVDVTSKSLVNFSLNPANFSVSGRIVGIPGGPALQQPFGGHDGDLAKPGAMVFLQKTTELPHDNPIADIMTPTDANGYFTVPSLTAGTYKMLVASLGYSGLSRTVTISTGSVDVGTLVLSRGGGLSGQIRKPDGSAPSQRELDFMAAVTSDLSELLVATMVKDPNTKTISGYSISGFRPGVSYRLILQGAGDSFGTPDEGKNIVFSTTTESRTLDLVLRTPPPAAFAKARRNGSNYALVFELSYPLRSKTDADSDLTQIISTFSAKGTLSNLELSPNRAQITGTYTPGVGESSFTLKLNGYSSVTNPDSLDPINPEFVYLSTFSFFTGVDGYLKSNVSNVNGGTLVCEGDDGRVAIPSGAFSVDASSTVEVTMQVSQERLSGASASGLRGSAANIASLRASGAAYPPDMLKALAATPEGVSPFSGFYDILLPLGVRTALAKPVKMTISYSTSVVDPTKLNLYWYNAAANAYILQQDVTGASPVIDTVNHTITLNVNHFSTFVMFNTGVAVITGNTFAGTEIEAYNFPNPFDLSVKTVATIHGGGSPSVRGTMIRFSLPQDVSGDASIRIFNVAGERVRTIDLGNVAGGNYFYQAWDGRNDSGRDVASGVYIGQVKVGGKSKFFKMALIK